jgi:hypothetical protein
MKSKNIRIGILLLILLTSEVRADPYLPPNGYGNGSNMPSNNVVSTNVSSSGSNALSGTSANAQNITFNSAPAPSTTTIRTTGNTSMGGFSGSFSSDYCGATAQASAGGIGFGIAAGGPKIDNACVMLRTFERTQQAAAAISQIDPIIAEKLRKASLEILGEIDPKIKNIFEKNGLIGDKQDIAKTDSNKSKSNSSDKVSSLVQERIKNNNSTLQLALPSLSSSDNTDEASKMKSFIAY